MKLYLDANIIIYAHEASLPLRNVVLQRLIDCCRQPNGCLVTSLFSYLECRVLPLRNGDGALLADYEQFFRGDAVEVVPVSRDILEIATTLRANQGFRSPDAIHLATAIHTKADLFLSADKALKKCSGIQVEVVSP